MSRPKDNSKVEVELDNLVHEEVIVDEESPMPTHIKYSLFTFILYFLGLKKMEVFEVQEKCEDSKEEWPEFKVNIFSRLTYSWFSNLLFTGYYQPLQHHHIWQMSESDSAYQIRTAFNRNWKKYSPSLLKALHHAFGWKFYSAAIPKFIYDNLNFTGPMLLGLIIDYLDDETAPYWHGLLLVFILTLSYVTQTILINIYFQIASRTGMHLRNAVVTAVYEKSLRLSNKARQEMSTGAIVDYMSNDAQRLNNITTYFHILWSGPYQILLALLMLYTLLGALPTLAGLIYMLLLIPVNSVFLKKNKKVRMDMMKITDDRVKWTNEVLQSMKAIKQYAYEYQFIQKITEIRSKELGKLLTFQLIKALNMWISYTSPIAVSVVSLSTYVLLGNELTASVIFPALALFNLLRFPLSVFPSMMTSAAEVWVSIKRIQNFLLAEEMIELNLVEDLPPSYSDSPSVLYLEGNFSWDHIEEDDNDDVDLIVGDDFNRANQKAKKKKDKSDKISLLENNEKEEGKEDLMEAPDAVPEKKATNSTLKNIRLVVGKNAKVGVIGQVGSGKSTLLSAVIGELYSAKQSKIGIKGRISYVPQQAWIMNDTVRNNIIFGATYNEERYNEVIRACALEPDLDQLSAGDLTEIGEKGINLSGGQKQRISIARAVYQNTDIYLLDDPLSAVDAMVAKHIFDRVICGLLKEKTVILVTHYLHLLSSLDYVVSMKEGEIDEQGSFNELIRNKGNFARLINDYTSSLNDVKQEELLLKPEEEIETNNYDKEVMPLNNSIPAIIATEIAPVKAKKEPELMEKEEREVGAVKFRMYYEYARSAGTSLFFIFIIFTYALAQFLKMGSDSWISYWTNDSQFDNHPLTFYFGIYLAWCGANAIVVIISNIATAFIVVGCSKNLHSNLLNQIIRAPTRFYESTPLGRILNRFAKDMDNIDTSVPDSLTTYLRTIIICIGTLLLVVFITPISIVALIPIMFFYYRVQLFYRASSREMKRIESISKSPIFAHFSETLNGLSSIRAYGVTKQFIKMNEGKTDYNNRAYFAMQTSNRWLSIRLEIIATTIVFICALVVITGSINSSVAGLLLSYTLSITGWLSWLVRSTADAEQQMNSVERVIFYSQLETEPPFFRESDKKLQPNWPAKGVIQFNDVILKYREGLEQNALNKVSFQIRSHEKIGVCGRTGAGKSSILVALFRLIELYGGSILIDDVDISKIGLHTLRKKLAIIPQDPVLFTGDIRSNLDPFDQYNDQQIWEALEMVQMKQTVEGLAGKLRYKVSEMGLGFSVGQRQLLSFARALLLKAEILLLDEATASCDLETDTLIQTTLREKFVNCTVITIAHRLNTIMDSDRILVMSDGEVVEFDEPYVLLTKQEGSHLLKMVEETGDAADHLISIAERKYLDLHPSADQFVL